MMPNNVFSLVPLPAPYLAPRTGVRFSAAAGSSDTHFGGRALGDASAGLQYQLWTCFTDGINVYLQPQNGPAFIQLPNVNAVWVALAFDQSSNVTIPYVDKNGSLFYYWFDSTIPGYTTSAVAGGPFTRVFAAFDDARVPMLTGSDVVIVYPKGGNIVSRQQRDRFGTEYTLGPSPGTLVQFGMNSKYRMQFQFAGTQKGSGDVPPAEYQLNVAGALNVP